MQVVFLAVDTAGFADDMLAGAVYPINGIGAELGQGVTCAAFTEVVPTVLCLLVIPDALDRGAGHKALDFVGRRECFVQWQLGMVPACVQAFGKRDSRGQSP